MNKSTPINQLPNQLPNQNTFVNDQQRQMITQAQQAINNSTMPQNTQLPSDMLTEDDSVIQDMLNNLNTSEQQQQIPSMSQQEEIMRLAAMNNLNINNLPQAQFNNPVFGMQPQYNMQQPQQPVQNHSNYVQQLTQLFSNDFKLIAIVIAVVLIVQFVPFHTYIGKYIAIDKIPYNDIILRAIIAGGLVIVLKNIVL